MGYSSLDLPVRTTICQFKRSRRTERHCFVIEDEARQTSPLRAPIDATRLDEVEGDDEIRALIGDLLVSPVLKRMLCSPSD